VSSYSADDLFQKFSRSIFQVRIVDINSGSQSSIGTGFSVDTGYVLATNYHVISSMITKPEQHRVEIETSEGTTLELEIVAFDVVHDLAILKSKDDVFLGDPIPLSSVELRKGKVLYSIGNPHDIGMTVVEGTYNGLVEHRFLDSIHFSGSINPGMSGGPVINEDAEVVGINVATSGDQIGFLVPVSKLAKLIEDKANLNDKEYFNVMSKQIGSYSSKVIDELLSTEWPLEAMGNAQVIGRISDKMECWGNTHEKEEFGLVTISKGCSNQDRIYISRQFNVGFFEYEFEHYKTSDWSRLTFYRFVTQKMSGARPGNSADKENVDAYQCHTSVVDSDNSLLTRKISYCVRPYQKLEGLQDVFYISISMDNDNEAFLEHYTLSGVSEQSASLFLQRFLGASSWQ
jgi:hypothetical protein